MAEDEEIPDYVKAQMENGPIARPDNFGPEDLVWTGFKGDLDPDEIVSERGQDPFDPLQLLLMALVRGQAPEASSHEIRSRTQKALTAITGEAPRRGAIERNYHPMLLEIAWRYFEALYENNMNEKGIELQPLVRDVLGDDRDAIAAENGINPDNLERNLVKKFAKTKDLYLSRATLDDDWDRVRGFPDLNAAIESLAAAGIPINQTVLKPTRLTKNRNK